MSVFAIRDIKHGEAKLFMDESGGVDIQRFETSKYPIFTKLLDQQQSFFWRPTEFNLGKDVGDFKSLSEAQEHVFTSNLKRQILLDSVQGRAPVLCYGQLVSDPALEALIVWWSAMEVIHSQSYTHIIRTVYPNPSAVFDSMRDVKELVDCGVDVSKYYDDLSAAIKHYPWGHIEIKRALYRSLLATNALEQVRFHVSFACTFAFGQQDLMTGSSKIIGAIRQDEALHSAITQNLLKLLPLDDVDYVQIAEEEAENSKKILMEVYHQELKWVEYLFLKGPIFGLTEEELKQYLTWLVAGVMNRMGINHDLTPPKTKPLPWLRRWEDGKADQVAPQESELISYQVGNIDMDMDSAEIDFEI